MRMRTAKVFSLACTLCGVMLWVFAVISWAASPDIAERIDLTQDVHIAINRQRVVELERRMNAMEDRLFQIFLATGGTLLASIASLVRSEMNVRKNASGHPRPAPPA